MNSMRPRPEPTWVNREFINGAVFHYERISDEQARALGIDPLPKVRFGSTIKRPGMVARRLRDGSIHAAIESTSSLMRDKSYSAFMTKVVEGSIPLDPEDHANINVWPNSREGTWNYNPATGFVAWDCSARGADGSVDKDGGIISLEGTLARVFPQDRDQLRDALQLSVATGRDIQFSYRIPIRGVMKLMRARGTHVPCADTGGTVIAGMVVEVGAMPPMGMSPSDLSRCIPRA